MIVDVCLRHLATVEKFRQPLRKGKLDAALVDGRFRVPVALLLLTYIHDKSVVIIHDFSVRPSYEPVLRYYDVIGRSRTVVALQRKRPSELPSGWKSAHEQFCHLQN